MGMLAGIIRPRAGRFPKRLARATQDQKGVTHGAGTKVPRLFFINVESYMFIKQKGFQCPN